uniref:Uncharacterized protein n=1 Tax=Arundo donax TaxID=35708 RepID=A0A0A8YK45_ARUDO
MLKILPHNKIQLHVSDCSCRLAFPDEGPLLPPSRPRREDT